MPAEAVRKELRGKLAFTKRARLRITILHYGHLTDFFFEEQGGIINADVAVNPVDALRFPF